MAITANHSRIHSSADHRSRRHISSPWNQVVLVQSETVVDASSSSSAVAAVLEPYSSDDMTVDESSCSAECSDNYGANSGGSVKKPAWNNPSFNGAASSEGMLQIVDAVSWPSLSASAGASTKPELELSLSNGLLNGSSSAPQFQGTGCTPSSSERQVSGNVSVVNNMVPTRHKLFKHNSSNASTNDDHPQQSAPQISTAATGSHNAYPRDHTQRSGFVSNGHPVQRNSYRNRNSAPHQRGNDAHHHSYGNRRDQEWNTHRNYHGRETPIPTPRAVPRFVRPPPNSAQFNHPPPMQPFGSPTGFPELAPAVVFVPGPPPPPVSLTGVSFISQVPSLFFTGPDPQLHAKVVNQIDYYFSNENLVKDTFLRRNMDSQGWVPIKLIAGFNKVMQLTDSIQVILDAVWTSSVVELQGDKVRRRNDWRRWVMPPSVQLPNVTASQTLGTLNHDMLAEQVQNIALESTNYDGVGGLDVVHDASEHRPSFGNLNTPLQLSTMEHSGQVGIQGSDYSNSARN